MDPMLQTIGSIAQILCVPLIGIVVVWIIPVERRLSTIEGYCKGRNCGDKEGG